MLIITPLAASNTRDMSSRYFCLMMPLVQLPATSRQPRHYFRKHARRRELSLAERVAARLVEFALASPRFPSRILDTPPSFVSLRVVIVQ